MAETSPFQLRSPTDADLSSAHHAWAHGRNRYTLDTETRWYRVLRADDKQSAVAYAKVCFASESPARFSPIKAPNGKIVPVAYAGNSERIALWEVVLRNIRHAGIRRVPEHETRDRYLIEVKPARPLTLFDVRRPHDIGLATMGTRPPDLTQAWPAGYPVTRAWAQAVRDRIPLLDGLIYESHQVSGDCIVLFQPEPDTQVFEVIGHAQSVRQEPVRSRLVAEADLAAIAIDFGEDLDAEPER